MIPEALVSAVKQKKAILFAGAGLSCTLGLPLFDALTAHLRARLDLENGRQFDFPALAEYYLLQKPEAAAELFQWMKNTWHPGNIDIRSSEVHNYILDLDLPVIYTTNHDSWLECAYSARGKAFKKVVGVRDLAETHPKETEIIKFHGDFEDPSSIVLTESKFLSRMSLDQPLDIRLRSDSLARPILFVGYSVSDPNIRYLLFKLRELWAQHSDGRKKPASYVLMIKRQPVQERLLLERGVEPIVWEEPNPNQALAHFFAALAHAVAQREGVGAS
jgi:hypothetical protein